MNDPYWRGLVTPAFNTEQETAMDLNALSFDQLVPSNSKYLTKDDVGEDGLILTIKGFKVETLKSDEGEEDKVVMYFNEDVKPMVLNRTNSQLVAQATGAKVAGDAVGKQVVVYNDMTVSFGGKVTGGLRVKKLSGPPRAAAARPASRLVNADPEDVPF